MNNIVKMHQFIRLVLLFIYLEGIDRLLSNIGREEMEVKIMEVILSQLIRLEPMNKGWTTIKKALSPI